ncbi:hypothetical protein M109_3172 [Bacteroides fragilis str. 3397 N2]|nr:hypothetical protein M109_3172 [Bacteroides fragilis str. 3397 N2]EXZ52871.1 hypothetical protein M108_3254 [Bacteroides fragilis str. 3397 T14]EYA42537.1 hypothetical protein M110_3297 [Bacteroides fragilis str. 3397 N3]
MLSVILHKLKTDRQWEYLSVSQLFEAYTLSYKIVLYHY